MVPDVVVLPDSVDDPNDPLAWLGFNGRWGERQGGPFNGPTGPAAKDRWLDPAPWFELRLAHEVDPVVRCLIEPHRGAERLVLGGRRALLRPHADIEQRRGRHAQKSRRRPHRHATAGKSRDTLYQGGSIALLVVWTELAS